MLTSGGLRKPAPRGWRYCLARKSRRLLRLVELLLGYYWRECVWRPDRGIRVSTAPNIGSAEAVWGWARAEATGNLRLGTKASVQKRVGNFLYGLSSRKDEVRRRCRTILQSRGNHVVVSQRPNRLGSIPAPAGLWAFPFGLPGPQWGQGRAGKVSSTVGVARLRAYRLLLIKGCDSTVLRNKRRTGRCLSPSVAEGCVLGRPGCSGGGCERRLLAICAWEQGGGAGEGRQIPGPGSPSGKMR